MDKQTIIGNWNIAKGRFKQRYARLTNNNTRFVAGMKDELTGRIQKRAARHVKKNRADLGSCPRTSK